jgi:hypothetical protein
MFRRVGSQRLCHSLRHLPKLVIGQLHGFRCCQKNKLLRVARQMAAASGDAGRFLLNPQGRGLA